MEVLLSTGPTPSSFLGKTKFFTSDRLCAQVEEKKYLVVHIESYIGNEFDQQPW